jgi:hypothetical protein
MENIIYLAIGGAIGFIVGIFVYRNNKGLSKVADKADNIVKEVKK